MDRATFLGRLAGMTQIVFAILLGGVASFGFEPGFIPRGAVLLVLFALPGVVGLIGIRANRPALILAAALTSFVGAFIAFSGVTLIFLVPALLFLVSAGLFAASSRPRGPVEWLGAAGRLLIGSAIVVLIVGAGASALIVTDSACWSEYRTWAGPHIDVGPYTTGEIDVPQGATSSGCSTGLMSLRGVGLGGVLGGAALGLALVTPRRRSG